MRNILFLVILLFTGHSQLTGQSGLYAGNPDDSFFNARDLAFAGKHVIARDTLQRILTRYPDYSDVRNLLAKTYSWDGDFDEARKHFNRITSIDRKNKEAWIAAIKNEIYAQNSHIALGLANKALIYLPQDNEIVELQDNLSSELQGSRELLEEESTADSLELGNFKNQMAIYNAFYFFDVV